MSRVSGRISIGVVVLGLLVSACGTTRSAVRNGSAAVGAQTTSGLVANVDGFSFPNFPASSSPEQFSAADVAAMFGNTSSVCRDGKSPCELIAQAAGWARMVNQARQSGHCEGFAALAAARFAQKATPPTVSLKNTGDVTHAIMRSFATQFEQSVQKETSSWAKKSLKDKVDALQKALSSGKEEYSLGIYSAEGGHAVLPYALNYLSKDVVRIMVYDSNWPGAQRWVQVDLSKKTWTFSYSGADPNNDPRAWSGKSGDMDITSMTSRATGKCPFCGGKVGVDTSLFVIRSAALNWSVQTPSGTLSPVNRDAGDNYARPLKAGSATASGLSDYVVSVNAGQRITMTLPAAAHITGVTPSASIETQTSGTTTTAIQINDSSIATSDATAIVTLAAGDLVATANGNNTSIDASAGNQLAVHVETSTGIPINVAVTPSTPAVEVRTSGNPDLGTGLVSQVLVQKAEGTVEVKSVTTTGTTTVTTQSAPLANTQVAVDLPANLAGATTLTALPPAAERVYVADTTTTSTTSTTVLATTTTVKSTTKTTTGSTTAPTSTTAAVSTAGTPWVVGFDSQAGVASYRDTTSDTGGNLYAIQNFCGSSLTIGSKSINGNASASVCSIAVTKFSSDGSLLWAVPMIGTGSLNSGESIAVDSSKNVYVTGYFNGASLTAGSVSISSAASGANTFIVKFSSAGVPQWGRVLGGSSTQYLSTNLMSELVASGSNVYAIGEINGASRTITFDGVAALNSSSNFDLFITSINTSDGTSNWARSYPVNPGQLSGAVNLHNRATVDTAGNVYVAGEFSASSITIGTAAMANAGTGTSDVYLLKVNSSGTTQWSMRFGGAQSETVSEVTSTGSGLILAGTMKSASMSLGSVTVTNSGSSAVYSVQVSSSGAFSNAVTIQNLNLNGSRGSIAVDTTGVYVAGTFNTPFTMGPTTFTPVGSDVFIFKFTFNGSLLWGQHIGNAADNDEAFVDAVPNGVVLSFDSSDTSPIVIGSRTFSGKSAYMVFFTPDGTTV